MRNPNKFRETAIRLFLSAELFVVLLISFTDKIVFSIFGIAAIVIYYILNLIFWTCPECKKILPWSGGKIYICPYCGCVIEEKND